ncbi:MAG: hypothetical protein QOE18_590, partial [Chloroflexota bacterium]|nr:hypothetical protein [Chloroflexota bacterium]
TGSTPAVFGEPTTARRLLEGRNRSRRDGHVGLALLEERVAEAASDPRDHLAAGQRDLRPAAARARLAGGRVSLFRFDV